jgi:hypothetical protein
MGGMVPTAAMSALQLGMDSAQQDASRQQAKAEAQAQTQQIQQTQQVQSQQRQDQLRRALATQRARFGAQGIAATGGSVDATLAGLQAEADRDEANAQSLNSLRISRINNQADWQGRKSLFDVSSQQYRTAFSIMQRGLNSTSLLGGD